MHKCFRNCYKMKLKIKIHPNSSKEEIKKIDKDKLEIWVKEKPINNKANLKLIKLLKNYFKKEVEIKSGLNSRNKTIEIK